jgi:outer membrane protein OmpA-like peptidoglycan-associated protein
MHRTHSIAGVAVALLFASMTTAWAQGRPFVGLDVGASEPTNGNYRGHVRVGAAANPYVGYMFNRYLGVQGQVHFSFQTIDHHADFPDNRNQTTTLLGGTVGPRATVPLSFLLDDLDLYATAQGGVFTGLSGRLTHTAPGFSVGTGLEYHLTPSVAVSVFGRWNRSYMSPRPKDLGPGQVPSERFGEDIQWATGGLGVRYTFVEKEAPPPPPPPLPPVEPTPAPVPIQKRIVLRNVLFDFDKAVIRPDGQPVLDEAVQLLKDEGDVAIIAEGHTDSVGTDEYNQELSLRRANAVRDYLIAHGIAAARIRIDGFGESRPVASNDTADGRAQNRRVELRVLP